MALCRTPFLRSVMMRPVSCPGPFNAPDPRIRARSEMRSPEQRISKV